MGYTRLRYTRSSYFGYLTPGVKWLLISNVSVFLLTYPPLVGSAINRQATLLLGLRAEAVVHILMVWQIITYMFVHGGITHVLFNMLALWMFGSMLEQDWGTRRFLKYYFLCGAAAGLCVIAVNVLIGDWYTPTIGASGAIFGLLLAFGVMYPNQTVLMNFLFPIKAKYMVMIYAAIELLLTFGPNTGVSTVAHLGGMVFGYIYLKSRWPRFGLAEAQSAYNQWRLQRAKRKFQLYLRKQGKGGGPWVN